jgi:predicted nucleic acid-binding Zn ribbon protein
VITGSVTVTLHDSAGGNSLTCGLACDSSGSIGPPPTNSTSCNAPFRVHDMSYTLSYIDTDTSNPGSPLSGSISETGIILKGSGFSIQTGPASHPGDTVTLDVK